jgi:hypothetical protein
MILSFSFNIFIAFIRLYIAYTPLVQVQIFRGLAKTTKPPRLGVVISAFECWLYYKKGKQKKSVVRTMTVRTLTVRKIDCKKNRL